MKKLFILAILLLSVALIGCDREEERTPEGWALYYAEQEYEKDYSGYELFGYQVEDCIVYEEQRSEDYSSRLYQITFINDSGKSVEYNVFIAYIERGFPPYIEFNTIPEKNVIGVDIEVATEWKKEDTTYYCQTEK